jgi:hypothetical protein
MKVGNGKIGQAPEAQPYYTANYKAWLAISAVCSGLVRMGIDACVLYYTYSRGHGIAFGFGALVAVMLIWSKLVTQPLYSKVKEAFGPELRRASEPNTTWKDLTFAVAAAFAKRRGAQ